jgi:hypothetical protein
MPSSIKSQDAIVPARPSPPRQWTRTSEPFRKIDRSSSPTAPHFSSKRWSGHVDDRKVKPQHIPPYHLLAETFHPQQGKLLRLNESDDCRCAPVADRIEVCAKIPIPSAAHCVRVIFPRTERYPNPPKSGHARGDRCYLQGVRDRCLHDAVRLCFHQVSRPACGAGTFAFFAPFRTQLPAAFPGLDRLD